MLHYTLTFVPLHTCSTHLLHKLLLWDLHNVQVSSVAVPVEGEVVARHLPQNEQQQLIVVLLVGQIVGKGLHRERGRSVVDVCMKHLKLVW